MNLVAFGGKTRLIYGYFYPILLHLGCKLNDYKLQKSMRVVCLFLYNLFFIEYACSMPVSMSVLFFNRILTKTYQKFRNMKNAQKE